MTDPDDIDHEGSHSDSKRSRDRTVRIDDRERLRRELDTFAAESGTVSETENGLVCDFASARFVIRFDGEIEAGMPLHDFAGRVEALRFDHTNGAITALGAIANSAGRETDDGTESDNGDGDDDREGVDCRVRYTFRRP